MATQHNFRIKNGLEVAGTERITAAGAFTGSIASATTGTTQSASDNTTKLATTAFTTTAITNVIGGAPGTLNTLNELAAAINDDASYASTLTSALATKLPLAGGTMTGGLINTSTAGITSNSTSHAYLTANSSATSTASWVQHKQGGTGRWLAGVEGNETDYQLYAGSATRLRVTAAGVVTIPGTLSVTGNVGIGQAAGSKNLEVKGRIQLTRSVDAGHASEGNWDFNISHEDAARYGSLYLTPSVSTAEIGFMQNKFRFSHDGFLGIGVGTTAPAAGIHLAESASGTYLRMDDGANNLFQFKASTNEGILEVQGTGFSSWKPLDLRANYFVFKPNNTEIMRIIGGAVGIGVSDPDTSLEVNIKNAGDGNGIHITSTSTTNDPALKISRNGGAADAFRITTRGGAGSAYLAIARNGNLDGGISLSPGDDVGIDTPFPKAKLHIAPAAGGDGHAFDGKNISLTTSYNTNAQLVINLADHQACYVKVFITGDWSGHGAIAFLGEYFVQNGGTGYAEPGHIIREVDHTASGNSYPASGGEGISSQIVDPTDDNFAIQFKLNGSGSTTGLLTYQIMGQFDSIT